MVIRKRLIFLQTVIHRYTALERGVLFTLKGISEVSNEVKQVLHDRMTESVFNQY